MTIPAHEERAVVVQDFVECAVPPPVRWSGSRHLGALDNESNVCSTLRRVGRRYEIEILRRSLALLAPGVRALTRVESLELVEELAELRSRLDRLEDGLRALLADA